jgi:hypothetical protein
VSIGYRAGADLASSGTFNTFVGGSAGENVTTGDYNCVFGNAACATLTTGGGTTIIGYGANVATSSALYSIAIGYETIASNAQIAIGKYASTSLYTLCAIQGIYGRTSPSGGAVYVNANGVLGTTTSSKRFKQNIRKTEKSIIDKLDDIKVMTYDRIDGSGINEIGIIAEDLEELNIGPGIVYYDEEDKPLGYNREALVPLMIDYIQELKQRCDQLDAEVFILRVRMSELESK